MGGLGGITFGFSSAASTVSVASTEISSSFLSGFDIGIGY